MDCAAIIVAAGRSARMGFDKLSADLAGKPVLQRSLDALALSGLFGEIVVVTTAERFEALTLPDLHVHQVEGGRERHFSVIAGLESLQSNPDLVAVHDGARPLVRDEMIAECLAAARQHGAAALARPLTETIKRAGAHGLTMGSIPRENLWIMETPQAFRTDTLLRAYEGVLRENLTVTDEVSAVETLGIPAFLVESRFPNPKITVPGDLAVAAALLGR
jgi:2-C-methyl-D-erythritol 4-phosphate cytidylyltransferase